MENSYKFFANRACRYYPCHRGVEDFNCLFCYCPLYMEEHCPGSPSWILRGDKVIKDCTNCTFPHIPENYEKMLDFLRFRNSKREISDDLRKKLESRAQDEGEKK